MANRNEKEASRKRILSTCVRLFLEQLLSMLQS